MRHSEYTAYFRHLCEKHKSILHSETESHFARIVLSEDDLGYLNLEEFIAGQQSTLVVPFMLLAAAENVFEDNRSDNIKKHFSAMFWLLTTYTDFDNEEKAYDDMELVAEQFLAKIKEDFTTGINTATETKKKFYSLEGSTISKVGKIGEFVGVRVSLQFFTGANQNLFHNPANWIN